MPERDVSLLLEDILESIDKIGRYTGHMEFEDFKRNDIVADAVVRNIEIIGEACRIIPETIRAKYSAVPWRRIIGFRNIAIHQYFKVDLEILWTVVTEGLPGIKPQLEKILEELRGK